MSIALLAASLAAPAGFAIAKELGSSDAPAPVVQDGTARECPEVAGTYEESGLQAESFVGDCPSPAQAEASAAELNGMAAIDARFEALRDSGSLPAESSGGPGHLVP